MLKREDYIKQIEDAFARLQSAIHLRSRANLLDLNLIAEDFVKDLLNITFDYQLVNLNAHFHNQAGIDLGDDENRICFQVTSTNTRDKIQDSIEKYINNCLHLRYEQFCVFILQPKKKSYKPFETYNLFQFNPKEHILDFSDLLKRARSLDLARLKTICVMIEQNIKLDANLIPDNDDEVLKFYKWNSASKLTNQSSEKVYQNYIDDMQTLLLTHNLCESPPNSEIRTIARTRTLNILRQTNGKYKGYVVQFLHEAGLLKTFWNGKDFKFGDHSPIIQLRGADLRNAILKGASLTNVHLEQVDLIDADMSKTYLSGSCFLGSLLIGVNLHKSNLEYAGLQNTRMNSSDLSYSSLIEANISVSNLSKANLNHAKLCRAEIWMTALLEADLSDALLDDANFFGANLTGAIVKAEQLAKVKKLPAIKPDGTNSGD